MAPVQVEEADASKKCMEKRLRIQYALLLPENQWVVSCKPWVAAARGDGLFELLRLREAAKSEAKAPGVPVPYRDSRPDPFENPECPDPGIVLNPFT